MNVRMTTVAAGLLVLWCGGGAVGAAPGTPAPTGDTARKVWVYFHDKGFTSPADEAAAVAALERTYAPRAVERRRQRRTAPGLFDARDLPVSPAYLAAVTAAGGEVHVSSRWLNAASVRATPDEAAAIRALPCVARVEPVRAGRGRGDSRPTMRGPLAPGGEGGGGARSFYGLSEFQLAQITLPALHDAGYTGAGVVIGVLDTGFWLAHAAFNDPVRPLHVVAEHDFINGDGNTGIEPGDHPDQHFHGTAILSVISGYRPGEFVGGAYDAAVILCKTEDITSETPIEEDNYVAGLEFIEAHGGDVATSSLGYIDWYTQEDLDGQTAVTTIGVNVATENGVYCCTAAGNMGHDDVPGTSHLMAPGDAFRVITVGAVSSEGSVVGFSADGPTADGRVKPEVLAMGADVWCVWPYDTGSYALVAGTSIATPLVAGAVACLAQAHPTWTVDQLRNMLLKTASDYAGTGTFDPLYVRGYGLVDAHAACASDCNANGVPDAEDIAGGASRDHNRDGVPDECQCVADLNGDGSLNSLDLLAFLNLFDASDPLADWDENGVQNSLDLLAYLNAFNDGC